MQHIIYGLYDPSDVNQEIRYVGYTSKKASRRLFEHLREARERKRVNHRHHWLNKLLRNGLRPCLVVLEVVTLETWQERERFWISQFPRLVNSTVGGEGLVNPSEDVRKRISASLSIALAGKYPGNRAGVPHDAVARANISAGIRASAKTQAYHRRRKGQPGPKLSDETKEKIRQSKLGKPHPQTPEWTARIAAGHVGLKQSPETIAKRAKSQMGNQRALGYRHTDAARDAISKKRLGSRLITDGNQRKLLKAGELLPDGWNFVRRQLGET